MYTVFHKIGTPLYFFNNIFKCWSMCACYCIF